MKHNTRLTRHITLGEEDGRLHPHTPSAGWCPVVVGPSDVGYGCQVACTSSSLDAQHHQQLAESSWLHSQLAPSV